MTEELDGDRDNLRWALIEFSDALVITAYSDSVNNAEYIKSISHRTSGRTAPEIKVREYDDSVFENKSPAASDEEKLTQYKNLSVALKNAGYYEAVENRLEEAGLDAQHQTEIGEQVDVLEPIDSLKNLSIRLGEFEGELKSSESPEALKMYRYKISNTKSAIGQLIGTVIDLSYDKDYYTPGSEKSDALSKESSKRSLWLIALFAVIVLLLGVVLVILIVDNGGAIATVQTLMAEISQSSLLEP